MRLFRDHFFVSIAAGAALFLIFLELPVPAQSAQLVVISDEISSLAPNTNTNHTIKFTTLSGADAPTDTIDITFDSGFVLGSITPADISLTHGPSGTEFIETLSGFPGTAVWGVTISGPTISFTHPTTPGNGDIAPSDKVIIKIGTHVPGGSNRIKNPATRGSKKIMINGTFGDQGALAVPITNATIGVNALFGEQPSSGGGTNEPAPTNPPSIETDNCPVFSDSATITGMHDIGTVVYVNNSTQGVYYDNAGGWDSVRLLNLGTNTFIVFSQNSANGVSSDTVSFTVVRAVIGDNNGDAIVNDFDLAGLASHWEQDWCPSDYNNDGRIDDFDLSVIAWYWD